MLACYPNRFMRKLLPVAAALLTAGCGYIGEPLPPLANVPAGVADLTAAQRGSLIIVRFTVPQVTTEGVAIKSPLTLDLRTGAVGAGDAPLREDAFVASAAPVPQGPVENGSARYEIPSAAWTGKSLVLGVRVRGANGKSSRWSNLVTVPVVAPPEAPADLRAEAAAEGVRLSWRGPGADFRVFRRTAGGNLATLGDTPQPPWTDTLAEFGKPYSYLVQTIVKLGDNREAASEPSAEFSITPKDTFPPAAPTGLRATAAPNSAELSWERNAEPDLAGYRIYRAVPNGRFEKIADVGALPSYRDSTVEHGKTYRYAISAVDQSGNESPQSAPAEVVFE